jgi:hypothetical protein
MKSRRVGIAHGIDKFVEIEGLASYDSHPSYGDCDTADTTLPAVIAFYLVGLIPKKPNGEPILYLRQLS